MIAGRRILNASWLLVSMTIMIDVARSDEDDAHQELLMQGRELTPAAATELEKAAAADPEDIPSRTKLLAYYSSKGSKSPDAANARQELALWFIKNHPESPVSAAPEALNFGGQPNGFSEAKRLWLENVKVHHSDAKVLGNAATFFSNDAAAYEDVLKKAQELEPNSIEWSTRLGNYYRLNIRRTAKSVFSVFGTACTAFCQSPERQALTKNYEYELRCRITDCDGKK